ncbi:MarR family winged helix-turn-helix transcriptional regulator [Tepidibacillus fermentans]|uniref:DNA-binding MarR family transcriptional regulator n=1 Tax=Tepidibacillus fermentans TaxID=1281767 RepID=A0A4R3KDT7_9BACI|nr:MarR family transcriptional regulator [Tepidibacillus fermentans]TCS81265.1 DNA-binding MarR family transcriptional regulator [Tepidibacillus fermentans]
MSEALISELEQLFYEMNQLISSEKHRCLREGISLSQIWVLKQLEQDRQKISDLAESMGVSVPAITGLSDKLIIQGLAKRTRSDQDRRIVYLTISEKGRELLKEIRQERQKMMKIYFDGLPDQDLEHLIEIYRKIINNIKKKRNTE